MLMRPLFFSVRTAPHRFRASRHVSIGARKLLLTGGLALLMPLVAHATGAAELDAVVAALTAQAKVARDQADWELVERKRLQRLEAIEKHAAVHPDSKSLWVRAWQAMSDVDGGTDETAAPSPGLVNELKYKEAASRLRGIWDEMTSQPQGPVFGEIAVRLFDLSQQAKAVYVDALIPESPNFVVSVDDLQKILSTAIARDPCCIKAVPYRQYLNRPTPPATEAFLRAEVRPTLSERQKQLVGIGHPVIFPSPSSGGNQAPVAEQAERMDSPLMPWHAAVELVKAENLQTILDELNYTSFLTPEVWDPNYNYVLPGKIVAGRDAAGNPFRLLYGRFLYCRVIDRNAAGRTAVLYLDRDAKWHHRYLDILWRHPSRDEDDPATTEHVDFMDRLSARGQLEIGDARFSLYNCPLSAIDFLIQRNTKQFCITDANEILGLKRRERVPDKNFLANLASSPRNMEAIFTSPEVAQRIQQLRSSAPSLRHPLEDLLRPHGQPGQQLGLNPLLLVSESEPKSDGVSPRFFRQADGRPYLILDTNERLYFTLDKGIQAAVCQVDFGGVAATMPLHPSAIPPTMISATGLGSAFLKVFQTAGYDPAGALRELQRWVEDPRYCPSKLEKLLRPKTPRRQAGANANQAQTPVENLQRLLGDEGWSGSSDLWSGINRIFMQYGFRSLRDARGNWIYSRTIATALGSSDPQGGTPAARGGQGPATGNLDQYPFEFRTPDGKSRIPPAQIYRWQDYVDIKRNKYQEHLRKILVFHPCFPTIEAVQSEVLRGIEHPDERLPEYLVGGARATEGAQFDELQREWSLGKDRLTEPIAIWQVSNAENQRIMTPILASYTDRVLEAAQEGVHAKVLKHRMDLLDELERLPLDPEAREQLRGRQKELHSAWRDESRRSAGVLEPLIALQLESARFAARQKLRHKAIVFYNDLLTQLYPDTPAGDSRRLFAEVASTENVREFITYLEQLIGGYDLIMTVQLELAGVLQSAGLHNSAYSIWKRIADDVEFFVDPAVENARSYIESYGIRFGDRIETVTNRLHGTSRLALEAVRRAQLEPEWAKVAEPTDDVNRQWAAGFERLEKLWTLDDQGMAVGNLDRQIEDALKHLTTVHDPGFRNWLALKRVLVENERLALLFSTDLVVHPVSACPVGYDPEPAEGFGEPERAAVGILDRCDAQDIEAWVKQPEEARLKAPVAADAAFLLAWYWHDVGDLPKARASLTQLVRVASERIRVARATGQQTEGLVQERNRLAAVLSTTSLIQALPGLSGLKTDFSSLFVAQLSDWERRWFAAGLYGPHASQVGGELDATAEKVRFAIDRLGTDWRQDRVFFKDYEFDFGPIPDFVMAKALDPQQWGLFGRDQPPPLGAPPPGGAGQAGGNINNANAWRIGKEQADFFFKNLSIDPDAAKDIVLGGQ
jgi:hypothetical protein